MINIDIISFEFKHFYRSRAKIFSYIFFMVLCVVSIYNGFEMMQKQLNTIKEIKQNQHEQILEKIGWFDQGISGPVDKPWIDIHEPYWSVRSTPTYMIKEPSSLFPLGIGQSEQFGFYKKVNRWSSTYDSDMVEEISNYERLINGNIDFSFLIIFLLPILMIILTYNINGLEKDLKFYKLILSQNRRINNLLINRLLFYVLLIIFSIDILIISVALINYSFLSNMFDVLKLVLIANTYVLAFASFFYFINKKGQSSSSIAFRMISVWLVFCVIIPGSVHQYTSYKYPVNYMTDFLDVNRKQTYEVFKLSNTDLYYILIDLHRDLIDTKKSQEKILDSKLIRRSISTIVNQMNISAANLIEEQNNDKNKIIRSSYFFNPVTYTQNLWNSITETDYNSYRKFRLNIQNSIDKRNDLIIYDSWNDYKVDKDKYMLYLKDLTNQY